MTVIAAILGGVVSGFLGGVFSNDIRNFLFGARLDLDLTEQGSRFPTRYRDGSQGIFIRVRVRNLSLSIARSCRAFLTKIEKKNETGQFASTRYVESCQLLWAAQGDGSRPLDIPRGIEQYVDVVRSSSNSVQLCQTTVTPLIAYNDVLAEPGTYRLEVLVSGDGFIPKFYRIIVTHNGTWNEVTVEKEPGILAAAWTGRD
jgi:hypothetical protein